MDEMLTKKRTEKLALIRLFEEEETQQYEDKKARLEARQRQLLTLRQEFTVRRDSDAQRAAQHRAEELRDRPQPPPRKSQLSAVGGANGAAGATGTFGAAAGDQIPPDVDAGNDSPAPPPPSSPEREREKKKRRWRIGRSKK